MDGMEWDDVKVPMRIYEMWQTCRYEMDIKGFLETINYPAFSVLIVQLIDVPGGLDCRAS